MNIYRKAAETLVEENLRGCCEVIAKVVVSDRTTPYSIYIDDFEAVFGPEDSSKTIYWWGFMKTKENQLARSLALLFMAEMFQGEIENI